MSLEEFKAWLQARACDKPENDYGRGYQEAIRTVMRMLGEVNEKGIKDDVRCDNCAYYHKFADGYRGVCCCSEFITTIPIGKMPTGDKRCFFRPRGGRDND